MRRDRQGPRQAPTDNGHCREHVCEHNGQVEAAGAVNRDVGFVEPFSGSNLGYLAATS